MGRKPVEPAHVSNSVTRRLVREVRRQGGEVTFTRKGHLRVRGPDGRLAIIGHDVATGDGRAWRNTVACVRRHTGLDISGVV